LPARLGNADARFKAQEAGVSRMRHTFHRRCAGRGV